jgi:hypothetical protein
MYEYIAESTREFTNTASRLAAGECGAGYYEASSIIVNVLCALSAVAWSDDDRTTRKRFVETLVRYSDPASKITSVSIPLFIAHFIKNPDASKRDAATKLRSEKMPPLKDIILTGDDVDIDCDRLVLNYPCFSRPEIRKFSYADLLYREVRCGLVHTYSLGRATMPFPLTKRKALVSYVNSSIPGTPDKLIHFHFEGMLGLAQSIAGNLSKAMMLPLTAPALWWIEGA